MPGLARYAALTLALLLLSGCARSNTAETEMPNGIDPGSPFAAGYPALPAPGQPTPLGDRLPSGLYASPPSADTLAALATAAPSPDGLFRAVLNADGLWVTRIDGAWLWQVTLPPLTAPQAGDQAGAPGQGQGGAQGQAGAPGQAGAQGQTGAQSQAGAQGQTGSPAGAQGQTGSQAGAQGQTGAAAGEAPVPTGALQWTPRSTLLFADTAGRWLEADPLTARVVPLGAALNGATGVTPSPDGRQILFYKGNQLYTALRDGSQPQLVGENVTGYWDGAGQLVVEQKPGDQPQD